MNIWKSKEEISNFNALHTFMSVKTVFLLACFSVFKFNNFIFNFLTKSTTMKLNKASQQMEKRPKSQKSEIMCSHTQESRRSPKLKAVVSAQDLVTLVYSRVNQRKGTVGHGLRCWQVLPSNVDKAMTRNYRVV